MRLIIGGFLFLIFGCGTTSYQVDYIPTFNVSRENAKAIIEDVILHQPVPTAEKSVLVTNQFWEFFESEADMINFDGSDMGTPDNSEPKGRRFYFKDIHEVQIHSIKDYFAVRLIGSKKQKLNEIYTRKLTKARELANAFSSMKAKARFDF